MRYPALTILREHTGDAPTDRMQANRDALATFLADIPWLQGRMLDGDDDDTEPNVLTFTGSAAREVQTGLGRVVRGFLVLDAQDNAASLERDHTNLATDLRESHIRIYNSGGTVRAKVWVW